MTRFYVNAAGEYLGAYDGCEPPAGSIEVGHPPTNARQKWDGQLFAPVVDTREEINDKAKAALMALDLSSIRALREYVAAKADAPQLLKDKDAAAQVERGKIQ